MLGQVKVQLWRNKVFGEEECRSLRENLEIQLSYMVRKGSQTYLASSMADISSRGPLGSFSLLTGDT